MFILLKDYSGEEKARKEQKGKLAVQSGGVLTEWCWQERMNMSQNGKVNLFKKQNPLCRW